jgi:signal transduction histidine kinase
MKRAAKACWRSSRFILIGFSCLVPFAVHAVAASDSVPAQHIISAEMLEMSDGSAGPIAATLDPAALGDSWQTVTLPHSVLGHIVPRAAGPRSLTTWYRVRLGDIKSTGDTLSLYVVRWQVTGQMAVYGEGRLLYRSRGSPVWNAFRHPALFIPLTRVATEPPPRTVLIRIDRPPGTFSVMSSLWVGDSTPLYRRYALREWLEYQIPFIGSAAFLAVGFFALAVWAGRRHEWWYLLFSVTAFCQVTRRWHFYANLEQLPISDAWFGWLTVNALNWQIVVLHFFLGVLHRQPHRLLGHVLIGLGLGCTVLTLPPFHFVFPRLAIYLGAIAASLVVVVVGWRSSWRVGSREGLLLAGGHVISVAMGIRDWLAQNTPLFDKESLFLTPYATVGLLALFSYVMYRRYRGAIVGVERVNAGLEASLQAREAELAESYQRLREAEHRQTLSQERARLMQDMHDGIGSSLMSALRVVRHGKADEADVARVLESCIDDLKLTIDSMEPIEADLLLLLATLRFRLGPRLKSSGITLRWDVQDVPALNWLEPPYALHILRILQEALTNVIKHTRADDIRVATVAAEQGVRVTISDNGQGFELARALRAGGKGLSNQLRRAEAMGARVDWDSTARGTCFSLWLPLQKPG